MGGWECLQNKSVRHETPHQHHLEYLADRPAKGTDAGEGGKVGDDTFDQFHDSLVPSEIAEISSLLLEKGRDGLNEAVIQELHGEWVLG